MVGTFCSLFYKITSVMKFLFSLSLETKLNIVML